MFALAVVDLQRNRLLLARDYFGIKPLYYFVDGETSAFGSHIPSFLEVPGVQRRSNPGLLRQFLLTGFTDHRAETLVEGVLQVPPGHLLEFALEGSLAIRIEPFWQLALEPLLDITPAEAAEEVRRLVLRNVELHMRSKVPVGAGMSGGVDSSAIVMSMRHLSGADLDLHTFSYIADEKERSDEPWIKLVEAQSSSIVHRFNIEPGSLPTGIDRLVEVGGGPRRAVREPAVFAQYRLFEEAPSRNPGGPKWPRR
jgi:asparagine synthase (glutamine-hydrolysing)